jgi:hypothetical protein
MATNEVVSFTFRQLGSVVLRDVFMDASASMQDVISAACLPQVRAGGCEVFGPARRKGGARA